MNKLERVLATLHHERPDVIPNQEGFFDSTSQDKFLPAFAERRDWRPIEEPLAAQLAYAERMDTYIMTVGNGSLRSQVVETGENYHLLEFENGARWRIREQPFYRQYVDLPIKTEEDLDRIVMPDPRDPSRYEGVQERVDFFTERGYFTAGGVDGFFSGVWYRFRRYEDFMMDLAANRDFAKRVVRLAGEYNLAAAEELLRRGVHSISFPDDLGGKTGLFFSPECYRDCFFEWHRRLCELCHSYGAYVNMHSHGDINALLPSLVEAGVDMLNPVGPTDNMNLSEIKQEYGDRLTLLGGISKFIGEMGREELEDHVEQVIRVGSPGGGYMTMSEGGIPYTMSHEDFEFYLDILRKYRKAYGAR